MKKRCTSSQCRKYFTVKDDTRVCPHCGKLYPRLARKIVSVVVTDLGASPIKTAIIIHRMTKSTERFHQSYEQIRQNMPRFSYIALSDESAVTWCRLIEHAGGKAHVERRWR